MLFTLVWTFMMLCKFLLADGEVGHHHMFPLSPIIKRGSTLQLFCSLGKKLYPYNKNASHIIWTLNRDRIAQENYIIVNDSVSGLVIHNFNYGEAHVKCYVDFPVEKQLLAQTDVTSGFPPQRPENISCINYELKNITCNWTFERETYIETTYTIIGKHSSSSGLFLNDTWRSQNGSRSWNFPTDIYYPEFCIQLKLENPLGKAESPCILQKSAEILKIKPPPVEVKKIPGVKKMLTVSWKRGMNGRKCQIRYRNLKLNDSEEAYNFSQVSSQNSLNLTSLWSFTEYAVAIRCIVQRSRFWSEWSSEQNGVTEEEAPSKEVNLWRVLEKCQSNGSRQVHLFWKELKENESLGLILGYRIRCFTQSNRSLACAENTAKTSVTVHLAGEGHAISVIAHNAAGESPEAVLKIPSCAEESKDQPVVVIANASVLNDQIIVEWKTDSDIHSFVVEWYEVLEKDAFRRSWQYVKNTTRWTFQKGAFKQYKCYNISVYPMYNDEIKAPSSITTYFKEGPPSDGPAAEVENIGKNEATIKWKEIDKAKANGDIINYTIFYRPQGGIELGKTVNASLLQYRLESLQANVKYTAHVMASTIAGGTNGTAVTFSTIQLSVVEIVLIYISAGILMLCLLTCGLLWVLKKRTLKRIFWPKIPHPKLPEITSNNLEKLLKEPPSEENTVIPDVIGTLKVGDGVKCQLLTLEECSRQTKVTNKGVICLCEAAGGGEHDARKLILQTAPSLGKDIRSQQLLAPVSQELQRLEESSPEHYQNSDYRDDEKQGQPNNEENTAFNPYLKNTVWTREFLVGEDLSVPKKKERKNETVPISPCVSSGHRQQYVALDAVVTTGC